MPPVKMYANSREDSCKMPGLFNRRKKSQPANDRKRSPSRFRRKLAYTPNLWVLMSVFGGSDGGAALDGTHAQPWRGRRGAADIALAGLDRVHLHVACLLALPALRLSVAEESMRVRRPSFCMARALCSVTASADHPPLMSNPVVAVTPCHALRHCVAFAHVAARPHRQHPLHMFHMLMPAEPQHWPAVPPR